MLNINNKAWDRLRFKDIEALLSCDDDETVFFEFKSDKIAPREVAEEVCAFANTYGGYLLLGVENDKTITGCKQWTEHRIHTTMHDSLTPSPIFEVKRFKTVHGPIFVIRVEPGPFPPYITTRGKILQRLSSGSFPVKDSYSLNQMFSRRKDELAKIEQKISIAEFCTNTIIPDNLCAYIDLGFAPSFHDLQSVKNLFFDVDLAQLANTVKSVLTSYTISRLGNSLLITVGEITANRNGHKVAVPAGVNNFMEIMCDGSVRSRICFSLDEGTTCALVSQVNIINAAFPIIYKAVFGPKFYKNFVSAEKYEKLVVIKQFTPISDETLGEIAKKNAQRMEHHRVAFGGNIMVTSNRVPKTEFNTIDRHTFDLLKEKYNNDNLIDELFWVHHSGMGIFSDPESGFAEQ